MRAICALSFLLALAAGAEAEGYRPTRIAHAPVIDGRLDEPEWREALSVTDFVQRVPQEGHEPKEPTEVLLMYTASALFVGVRARGETPKDVVATVMRRDNFDLTQDDQFVIAIDSYDDGRSGYWFSTNPLGVRVDAQFGEEGEIWQGEWNGVWDCASRIEDDGWTSEMRIPFTTLRLHPGAENVMGINLFRRLIHTNEQLFAPLIPLRYANGTPNVSAARKYVFSGIEAGHDIRIRPYLLGRQEWLGAASTPPGGGHAKLGGDATYGLTPSLAASVTVNTDFALTELDDRQINLTRYDLFYPEKRDFFLENGGLFLFGLPQEAELFFSRRIGLRESDAGAAVEVPLRVGAKLTGRAGPLELGVLEASTSGSGSLGGENFLVARSKYGLGRRSYVGFAATHETIAGRFDNAALGLDAMAYLAGDVGVSGFAAATRDGGSSAWPAAWNATLFKRGEKTSFRAAVTDLDERFDPAVGFLLRRGVRKLDGELRLPWYVQKRVVRRLIADYSGSHVRRHGVGTESWTQGLSATLELQSDDSLKVYAQRSFDAVPEPFTIFRAQLVPIGRYRASLLGLTATTKPGRRLSGEVTGELADFYGGDRRTLAAHLSFRPSRSYSAGLDYSSSDVRLPGGAFRAQVIQARVDAARDTHLSARLLVQYDNASQDLGVNLRVNYLLREGTELAFVCGRRDDRSPDAVVSQRGPDTVALVKFTWLASF